jgi:diadenosine tetraphosphate (Ap4A) HIT family hydrolase
MADPAASTAPTEPTTTLEVAGDEHLSRLLTRGRQLVWTKPDPAHTFRGRLDGTRATPDEIVYQDDQVFAFRHRIDPTAAEWWEVHVVIIPKQWYPTLVDIGVGDVKLWSALIEGIQKVALKLGLFECGFQLRTGVFPPYQHTEHVHVHILAGKHNSPGIDGPLSHVE